MKLVYNNKIEETNIERGMKFMYTRRKEPIRAQAWLDSLVASFACVNESSAHRATGSLGFDSKTT